MRSTTLALVLQASFSLCGCGSAPQFAATYHAPAWFTDKSKAHDPVLLSFPTKSSIPDCIRSDGKLYVLTSYSRTRFGLYVEAGGDKWKESEIQSLVADPSQCPVA